MMELVILYKWVFLLLLVSSACLVLVGIHLTPRQQGVNTVMLTQVSSFGVLLGLLINESFFHYESLDFIFPLLVSLSFTFLTSYLIESFKKDFGESFYLVVFLLFMALSYWICSFFPGLDSHHADSFFGDIVTIHGVELILAVLGFSFGAFFLLLNQRSFLKKSFELEIFGKQVQNSKRDLFWPVSISLMVLGIFSLGMLYTLSFLLIGPTLLAFRSISFKIYLKLLVIVSCTSSVLGFLISLYFTRMSTVPSIVILLTIFCALILLLRFVKFKIT